MTEREKTLLLLRLHTLFIVDLTYTKLKLLKTKYLDKIPSNNICLMLSCVRHLVKVRVDPFFRDLDQFTILLPVKDLSSVHNPYFLAMNNMIAIRSRSFFFKAEN